MSILSQMKQLAQVRLHQNLMLKPVFVDKDLVEEPFEIRNRCFSCGAHMASFVNLRALSFC